MKNVNTLVLGLVFLCLTSLTFAQTGNTMYGEGSKSIGSYNTGFGYKVSKSATSSAKYNCYFGGYSGYFNEIGDANTCLGHDAGYRNKGSRNTYIGCGAGMNVPRGSGNVFIGYHAGQNKSSSNKLIIANKDDHNLIFGDFEDKYVDINGELWVYDDFKVFGEVQGELKLKKGLYFTPSTKHSDGLPQARIIHKWGMRYEAPVSKWVFSSKNTVLIGYEPNGTNYGNGSLLVEKKVGIGTTTPGSELDVAGTVMADEIISRKAGFESLTTEGLSVEDSLGIGTTSPSCELDVIGTVKADNFISSATSFPDYVFEKEYHVMPLKELESFVNEHKHLPNMPSEKEVVENGMDISDVTIKSVENIETMYLHIIELSKKVEALQQELEKYTTGK